jgi:hypothetical protein
MAPWPRDKIFVSASRSNKSCNTSLTPFQQVEDSITPTFVL